MERSEQELVRIEKLDKIREYCNPYPDKYDRTHTLKEARLLSDGTSDVRIAGSDLTPSTLCIDGLDCSPLVDEVSNLIKDKYTTMLGNLDEIIASAESVYNAKQEEYNQSARYRDQQEANRRAAMNSHSN